MVSPPSPPNLLCARTPACQSRCKNLCIVAVHWNMVQSKHPSRGKSDAIYPESLFGASKAAASLQLQQLARSKGLPLVILRLFHVYGPMESEYPLVPTAIRSFLTNQPMTLTERGYHHDFVYVGDVVKACLSAAAKDNLSGQIFNIASGSPVSNERVIALISAITNKRTQVTTGAFAPREWDKTDWFADISKAREQLGWQPETNLQMVYSDV